MKNNLIILIGVLVIIVGCSRSEQPVTPTADRLTQDFPLGAQVLFQGPNGYHDIDLAGLTSGPGTFIRGISWAINGFRTAAVTLERLLEPEPVLFKPKFRWLTDGTTGNHPEDFVADRDADVPDLLSDYRWPKSSALFFAEDPWQDSFVELVVCYQIHFYDEPGGVAGDWDIGMTILRWVTPTASLPLDDPVREDFVFESPNDQYHPDIAHDPTSGDIYLVYEDVQSGDPGPEVFLMYKRFERDENNHYQFIDDNPDAELAQGNVTHNGHTPSIDIGWLDLPDEDTVWVAIAYTSQYWDFPNQTEMNGFLTCISAWMVSEEPTPLLHNFAIRNPDFPWSNSGLPSIDLTPNYPGDKFGALVFNQQTASDAYGPVLDVYEIDIYDLQGGIDDTDFVLVSIEDEVNDIADGLFPSVFVHFDPDIGLNGTAFASITYMAQFAETDLLRPWAVRLNLTTNAVAPVWNNIVSGFIITGNYNISQLPFMDPGVSSAITGPGDTYWAAWCDRIKMEPPPLVVLGAHGNTVN